MDSQVLRNKHFDIQDYERISVVIFSKKIILDEKIIQEIDDDLLSLVERNHRYKIILDFNMVHFIDVKFLYKLISFNRKLYETGGRLVVCGIAKEIFQAFETITLNRLFIMSTDQQTAMESFGYRINPYLQ